MHIEELTETDTIIFNDTMQALGFKQHVTGPTHGQGNTLDLIFTELASEIQVTNCIVHRCILDHSVITINTSLNKEKIKRK